MNINTRDMPFINFNGQAMPFVKFNGVTVYERWIDLIVSGVPPLTLTNCKGVDLINYKIYGNSVQDGTPTPDNPVEIESVGDKTNNLFDLSILLDGIAIRYYTIDNNKVTATRANGMGWGSMTPFNLKPNTEYNLYLSNVATVDARTPNKVMLLNKTGTSMSFTTDDTGLACFKFFSTDNKYPYEIGYIHLVEKGTSVTGYEPYGKYKIPFKVNDTVTNIYLDEPLRKKGEYADYIDFENQKIVRNIEETDSTGTLPLEESLQVLATPIEETTELPNIPTIKGTNILEVDTTIQPSNLEVVYKGK